MNAHEPKTVMNAHKPKTVMNAHEPKTFMNAHQKLEASTCSCHGGAGMEHTVPPQHKRLNKRSSGKTSIPT